MSYPSRKSNLAFRPIANELVIIDLDGTRTFHQLNEVGAFIWQLCDGKHHLDSITQKIQDEFEINESEARNDVHTFIDELNQLNLLTC